MINRKWRYQFVWRIAGGELNVHSAVSLKVIQQTADMAKQLPGVSEWAIIDSKDRKSNGVWLPRVLDCSPNYLPF